jgi:hypothetical protein
MNRDPLYRTIEEALARLTDGNHFQECAAALLGKALPNLAPMPGGDDAGMDGAFGTPDGSFPLVCTIKPDVLGNFRDNVSTYLKKGSGRKRAVVATSQRLTNRKKRNLEKAASKLGVKLVNIYDAPYFANELYRDPKWRLELLGITGDPPALSALPRSGRFAKADLLIGRDEEVAWLKDVRGDALVVGQPGSGKTYLHQYLAKGHFCLFAVDDSLDRLADAIREQQPSVIVVDDAHLNFQLVEVLKRLRVEVGAAYHIHLNCWPGHEQSVQRILNIPDNRVKRLQPLRKREIFEIIEQMGIRGPDWLQHLLISQSDGKPGLAAALAEVCRTEGVAQVWSGEATARQLLGDLRLVRGEKERCVLAAFAVGGDVGMSFAQVSEALGLSTLELRQITAELGSGGVVEEIGADRLQVRPPTIRPVLVRDIFFGGPSSLAIDSLLIDGKYSAASTAAVLLSARQRGANIDQTCLERLVLASHSRDVWEHFAWVDVHCADTILEKYPEQVCYAATGLLNYTPSRALHALLDADDVNLVPQTGAVEHPRRRISEWLFPIDGEPVVTIERRLILLAVLEDRVRTHRVGNGASFTWALAEILQATFDITRTTPRGGGEFASIRGVASHSILAKIAGLWPRVRELSHHVSSATARTFFNQIENWCLPQRLSYAARIAEETFEMVQHSGRQMLSDILEMPHCNRAWRTRAATIAKWGRLNLQIEVDETFDALYSDRDYAENWQEQEKRRVSELCAIADNLLTHPVNYVLRYLTELRSEAVEFGDKNGNGFLWVVYHHIARKCQSPREWLDAFVAQTAPCEFLVPFIDRVSQEYSGQYEAILNRLLQCPNYQLLAISRSLRLPIPNEALLSSAFALLNNTELAGQLLLRDSGIPLEVMAKLLEHPNPVVRATAAIGEWQREPVSTIRPALEAQWQIAIREVNSDNYALNDIFERSPLIAFEWLQSRLGVGRLYLSIYDHALHTACRVLENSQRAQLLRLFTSSNFYTELFDLVIGDRVDLFADWLQYQKDEHLRLRPLDRDVSPRWEELAVLALDAGISPETLADHCLPNHWHGLGRLSEQFLARISAYEALSNHPDPRLRTAGKRGLRYIQSQAQHELEQERREETYGR